MYIYIYICIYIYFYICCGVLWIPVLARYPKDGPWDPWTVRTTLRPWPLEIATFQICFSVFSKLSITKRWNTSRLWKFMFISWHPAGWTPIILEDLVEKHLVGPAGRHHLKGDIQMLRSAATVNVALLTPGGIQHSWLVSLFADALVGRIAVAKTR